MKLTRREFFKLSGITAAGAVLSGLGLSFFSSCKSAVNKIKGINQKRSICPFCSMGCGLLVSVRQGQIVDIRGDADHPINQGKLCAKGCAAIQLTRMNRKRLKRIKYRAPYAEDWEEITWKEAAKRIANRIKNTRDKTFIESEGNTSANRTNGIAVIGGSFLTNEESYLLSKMSRLIGITHLSHDSELASMSSHTALSNTLGYGAMTNNWMDISHSDIALITGANPAESHPVLVKYLLKIKERGGKVVHIDPRYNRTSSLADHHVRIRPGTDIVFINGIINYALNNNRFHRDYIIEYTNASYLVDPGYGFRNGLFSGYKTGRYDNKTWNYQKDKKGIPETDKTLNNSSTVFRIMKAHFSRYTADNVSIATGCPSDTFLRIADMVTSSYKPEKTACIIFSSGATQHISGTQAVRAFAVLQLLLGNIGTAGGGIYPLGTESNAQGCMDHGLQSNYLPGYLPAPNVFDHATLDSYLKETIQITNDPMSIDLLSRREKHLISLLKAFYGDNASKRTYFCYDWLPKSCKAGYQKDIFDEMREGGIKGAVFAGANPVLGVHTNSVIKALENLEWLVVTDIFESETSAFWKMEVADAGSIGTRSIGTRSIGTEVFLLPSASPLEKEGSMTNACRWVQWMDRVADPPGESRSDLWIFDCLFRELRKIYKDDPNTFFPEPIIRSNWNYSDNGDIDPGIIAKELSGYEWDTKIPVDNGSELRDDGSTAAGNWLYCGSFTGSGNMMKNRLKRNAYNKSWIFRGWAWAWPGNTRILYNRAGVDRRGKPWNSEYWPVKWDNSWEGDSIDGGIGFGPGEKNPFIMLSEGVARLFAKDIINGPLPEHYEPLESPAVNIFNSINSDPFYINSAVSKNMAGKKQYPHLAITYRIAEGWRPGITGMNIPWLAELMPDIFCEISPSLAEAKGIKTGDKIEIASRRGSVTAYCLVTSRIQPLIINGSTEVIGLVVNSGREKITNNFNQLTGDFIDPNTSVPGSKTFFVDIRRI